MPLRPDFNARLRAYTPLGDPAAIIPDLGITVASTPDGPSLTATVSTVIYGTLPDHLEVAVEVWDSALGQWTEGRDSRFIIGLQDQDDRDRTGAATLTGVGIVQWLGQKAALAGVVPYSDTGTVEAAASSTTVHVSGTTFTWAAHVLGVGDRVRVKSKGSSKGLSTGSVYFVRNPTTSTFQLSHTAGGRILSFGSASNVSLERVKTRITNLSGHQFAKNMAVSVVDGSGSNLTDGSQYYVVNPTASTIQVASKPGGTPIELATNTLTVYRYLDGQRVWKAATAGQILGDAFLEARDRGWGQDASGADQVFHSWTNAGDSNALAWPARVDDPTITGVSVGFQPGTSLWAMTQFLVDNGWAEFASHARTFDLFAPSTGYDWSDAAGIVKRIGSSAEQVQVTKDLTDYRTAETVRGEANVENTVTVTRSPWGRLEQYVTASGVGSAKHAISYGKGDLAKYSAPAIGYQVTEAAAEAAWLPILDYQRGDWIQVQVKGVWTRLRVTQWSIAKDSSGTVRVTILLEHKKRSLLHKVAHATKKASGGRAAVSTSTTPQESDKRKAAKPSTLTVTARSTSQADKSAKGTVTATWLPVTTDDGGDDLTGAQYEVIVRSNGQQYGKVAAVTSHTTVDLPGYVAGEILAVSVRAISSTGTFGEASDEVEYVVDVPEDLPDAPSTPVVTSTLGSIVIAWDGNLVDATDGPHLPEAADALAYVAVQRSTDGTTWLTEAQTLAAAGSVTDLGLTVGTTYQYRLQAVSQTGTVSGYSPIASAAVVAVATGQINATFTQSVTDAANAAATAQTTANNASTAAGTAQTTANGKNTVHYSTAVATGAGTTVGDLWLQVDGSGHVIAQWTWSGAPAAWTPNLISGAVLTNLDAGSITTGTLAASRIAAGTIAASQLAIADFTNLFENPTFDGDTAGAFGQSIRGLVANSLARVEVVAGNNALVIQASTANVDVLGAAAIPIKSGDQFYAQVDAKTLSQTGTGGLRFQVQWLTAAQAVLSYSAFHADVTVVTLGTAGYATFTGSVTAPANAAYAVLVLTFVNNGETTNRLYLDNVIFRRKATGSLIVDGTIVGTHLAATAIDAMTITGATFRTASTAKTSGGVQIDSTGLHGYNASGVATFTLTTAGALTVTGADVTGKVTATSGSITGALTVSGSITAGTALLDSTGLTVKPVGSVNIKYGSYVDADATFYGVDWSIDPTGGTGLHDTYSHLGVTSNGSQMTLRSGGSLTLKSNWDGVGSATAMADFTLTNDGTPRVWSNAILNRNYTVASAVPGSATSSVNGIAVVTSSGTLGQLQGPLQQPDAYTRVISTRAVFVGSNGYLGTTSSSKRTKNLHRHLKMDDGVLEAWLGLPTWEFEYKPEIAPDSPGIHHGMVAEEVHDAGFTHLVYYDEREGDTKGQIDGLAYERMPVYNRMALQRLYARLMEAEKQITALTRKAAA